MISVRTHLSVAHAWDPARSESLPYDEALAGHSAEHATAPFTHHHDGTDLDTLGAAHGFAIGDTVRIANERSRFAGAVGRIGLFAGTLDSPRAVVFLGPSAPLVPLDQLEQEGDER